MSCNQNTLATLNFYVKIETHLFTSTMAAYPHTHTPTPPHFLGRFMRR